MLDIIAVTYGHTDILKCFINSIKAQTNKNWNLTLIHDGPNKDLHHDLEKNGYLSYDNIKLIQHPERTQNYGHLLRKWALQNVLKNKYVLLTNGDNYYAPIMVEEISHRNEDFVYFDCIHSHRNYNHLNCTLQWQGIDMGCAAIKSELAKRVGFNHSGYSADWEYFSDVLSHNPTIYKINKTLLTHN